MSKITSYFFDITTSSQWSGNPVGIVRVERELAARARKHLGSRLAFCVYDTTARDFKIVKEELVPGLLSGRLRIDFGTSSHGLASPTSRGLRRQLRNMALEVPAAYQFIQRLRGRTFSIEEVKLLRQQLRPQISPKHPTDILPLSAATLSIVALCDSVAIVTGGLDWEHKPLRDIYKLKQKFRFKYINVVYDLIPINLPHYVVPHYVNLLTEYFGELLWTTDGCLCISETTRIDFTDFCHENGVTPPNTCSFPLGSDLPSDPVPDDLPSLLKGMNYILFVSTIEPRKNHRTVYEAWCHALLKRTIDPRTSRLVFVGRQGWLTGDLVHEISTNPLTRDTIITLTNVSDSQLASLYRGASFTILPSLYEGYGLPLAEALGYGKVCLTSGAGALAEIGSDFRIDIDPRDTLGWATKMAELLNAPDEILQTEEKIRTGYKPTNWDESAQIFFDSLVRIAT